MGKGGKPKIEVTQYYMSEHLGVCVGPPDALLQVKVREKVAWSGEATELSAETINQENLFGGIKKEGGVSGTMTWLPGEADQVLPDALAQKLGRADGQDCPGFRGLASLFFTGTSGRGFYWTANSPYLPGVWATVRRILKRSDGSEQWYPETAAISRPLVEVSTVPYATYNFDIDADVDAATTSTGLVSTGYHIQTQNAGDIVKLTHWEGGSYQSFSPWGDPSPLNPDDPNPSNRSGAGVHLTYYRANVFNSGVIFGGWADGYAAGLAAFEEAFPDGATFSGDTDYYLGVVDSPIGDNSEGMSFTASLYSSVAYDMNPAHIIYESLTDTIWGMGTPTTALDETSFTEAADTLYTEGFGLSLLWTRQTTIEQFIQEILDHIQAVLFTDPATGLLTLKLIRGDYEADTLPELTPDNCDVLQFSRKLWGEIVNEVVVTWTNPENEQEETVTAQDLASIAMQGGVVSDSRNYYGVRSASLAQSLAWRDLRSAGQPLASVEVEADRTFWTQRPGGVAKLTWPEYALSEVVFRIVSIDYGKPGDMTIKMSLVEDVFGLDIGTYEEPPATEWEDPSAAPEPMEIVDILTLPYMFAVNSTVGDFIDTPEYPEVVAGVLATTSETDTYEYELWDEVTLSNGDLEWQRLSSNNVIGYATLTDALIPEVTSAGVLFTGLIGDTPPIVGGFAIIGNEGEEGNELAVIDADNGEVYGFDLIRGTLDTIPRAWPAGTPVWFVDESTVFEDPLVRAAAETVSYKLLSRTSQGLLALADADLESHTLTERPWLPSRPANVVAFGEAWSSEEAPIDARARPDPWVSTSWANRNRLTEDSVVLAWDDADVTPETGQTTRIDVCDNLGNVLVSHDGLSGTSFDVPDASFGSEGLVELRFYADRTDDDGEFASLQFFSHWVQVGGELLLLSGDMTDGDDLLLLGGDEDGRVQISGT